MESVRMILIIQEPSFSTKEEVEGILGEMKVNASVFWNKWLGLYLKKEGCGFFTVEEAKSFMERNMILSHRLFLDPVEWSDNVAVMSAK